MHSVRPIQEVAELFGQCAVILHQPAERRCVDRLGVVALADLRQLLRVAEQHEVPGRPRHRDGVGKAELARLLDDQQVQAGCLHPVVVREIPCGSADYAARVSRDEGCVLVLVDPLPRSVGRGVLLRDPCRIDYRP